MPFALSFILVSLFIALSSCTAIIRITTVVDSEQYKVTVNLKEKQTDRLVIFQEDVVMKLSRSLDLVIAKRDWKLLMSSLDGHDEHGKKLRLVGVVNGVKYSLKAALMAVGYPTELSTPIYPVVYVDDNDRITEYQLANRDWRRYVKCKELPSTTQALRVSPQTHNIHISPTEFETIEGIFKPGKVIKVKAGTDLNISLQHLFTVTTQDYRDRLINLTVDREDDRLSRFMDSGLDKEEAEEALICLQSMELLKRRV